MEETARTRTGLRMAIVGLGLGAVLAVAGGVVWAVAGGPGDARPRLSTERAVDAEGVSAALPPSALTLADVTHIRPLAVGRDGTRVWRAPALPSALPSALPFDRPGTPGVCIIVTAPHQAGTDCASAAEFARKGILMMVRADGAYSGVVVAPPGARGVEPEWATASSDGTVTFFRADGRRPVVRMVFPDRTVTLTG